MWVFHHQQDSREITADLSLDWEINGISIADAYDPEDTDALELWRIWVKRYGHQEHPQLGSGWATISWYVTSPAAKIIENAPFAYENELPPTPNFLDFFTWPQDEHTGARLRWSTLHVEDKAWTPGRADKGGFFQEATGWKPAPYQPLVHLPSLAGAAGLTY
jgi:hypothetical protein